MVPLAGQNFHVEPRRNRVYKAQNLHNIYNTFKHCLSSNILSLSLLVQTLNSLTHSLSVSQTLWLKYPNQSSSTPYLENTESVIPNTRISHPNQSSLFFLTIGFKLENPIPRKYIFLTIGFTLTPTNGSSDSFKFEGVFFL